MNVYVKKKMQLMDVSEQYRYYIENIHNEIYLPYLSTHKSQKITKECIKKYMEMKDPRELLYIFSYFKRKYYIENI
jgi:hypothetical protein